MTQTDDKTPPRSLIYTGLTIEECEKVDSLSRVRVIPQGSYLFHQQDEAHSLYSILDGVFMVERLSVTGLRQVMAFIFPGNFTGFTYDQTVEYGVRALTPATVAEFNRTEFMALCEVIPQLKFNMDSITGKLMIRLFDQLFAMGQKKAHERVCFFLQNFGRWQIDENNNIDLLMSRQDIADFLGLKIETVSRAFSQLKKDGVINFRSSNQVTILDPARLKRLADGI